MVPEFQVELQRPGPDDGRTRSCLESHNDLALGAMYVPEFEKRWSRYVRDVDGSWRCDETYIKVKGR